ncbi:general transcription factor 3C polypeptide 2 [Gouania willdenowi]|uniref:general transcription factor 3C polypeptide 2 n=1 Tax=Gouania willdenowi TaxID=441366 RepID=UPI00105622CE|nr:general transcription factor 3C polypeptide 2 [Gouania willdenowi]XP_028296473.1 general transcription factor 3C polypeptide 2 [Gouania willdenowi]XP_028296474.1 general transcription factor 3C polypeptide 2 [Gouania willdenowi]
MRKPKDLMESEREGQELTPSSRGRQRRKNTKYLDYETSNDAQRRPDTEKEVKEVKEEVDPAAPPPPRRGRGRPRSTPLQSEGPTPKKAAQGRKTGVGKTPTTPEDVTPRPKRKFVKKQKVNVSPEVPSKSEDSEHHQEEEEPGGRRRRGAAKKALKYLHRLANNVLEESSNQSDSDAPLRTNHARRSAGLCGRKRKRLDSSDSAVDHDFVPDGAEEDEENEEDEEEDEGEEEGMEEDDEEEEEEFSKGLKTRNLNYKSTNGLTHKSLKLVLDSARLTQRLRKQHFSTCVFPQWIPSSSDWDPVPQSEVETYLPQELQSAAFKVSREGLQGEDSPQQRLHRFEALPPHPQRWDMMLFVGGPVWALEWCPTPDGRSAPQYVALAAHRGMDELHNIKDTYSGPGLVQLWDVGELDYNSRPQQTSSMSYSLVLEHGFVWQLKFCPSGGWESPLTPRQDPLLPRLALLAVATSNGEVGVYSLPHPHAVHASKPRPSGNKGGGPSVYKAAPVLTLKLGSLKAPRQQRSGMILSLDWLPMKPHDVLAAGFYDGTVALWNLSAKSPLLRVRDPKHRVTLLPYRCFLAHDQAVRGLTFCPASSHLLATAGEDRYVKMWDLGRLSDPVTSQRRFTNNEVHWLLNASGLLVAMDVGYTPHSSRGLYYTDVCTRWLPVFPRPSTLWSVSYSDWLHSVLVCDAVGDVIFNLLPQMNYCHNYIKRHADKRFPLFLSSLIPCEKEKDEHMMTEEQNDAPERGEERMNGGGGGGGEETYSNERWNFPKYREAATKYCLQLTDFNPSLSVHVTQQFVWKQMKKNETTAKLDLDVMNLSALHKVRFNPNQRSHVWVASGGQAGLVRLMCVKNMITTHMKKVIIKDQSDFTCASPDQTEAPQQEV